MQRHKSSARKIIIDTDPAIGIALRDIDDALAIWFLLASPEVEVLGLTTTFGNASLPTTFRKAREILEVVGRSDIPILRGSFCWRHLERETDASRFIVETALRQPGEITIVAIGPVGNLAAALNANPEVASAVREVVSLGGTIYPERQVYPHFPFEFNYWIHPHAADRFLRASVRKTIVPMDVCYRVVFGSAELERWKSMGGTIIGRYELSIKRWIRLNHLVFRKGGFFPWDVIASAYVVDPSLFTEREFRSLGMHMRGFHRTVVLDPGGDATEAEVLLEIEASRFLDLMVRRLAML